jgi:DNA-binding beta-propeller fold protein YncE
MGAVVPISTATNTAGKPIRIGTDVTIAMTPDGKTLYAATVNKLVPISTATNTPGRPIHIPIRGDHPFAVITP